MLLSVLYIDFKIQYITTYTKYKFKHQTKCCESPQKLKYTSETLWSVLLRDELFGSFENFSYVNNNVNVC